MTPAAYLAELTWPALGYPDAAALAQALGALQREGHDRLPLPGSGQTLARWQALAQMGGHDLALCKLYEGHTDALAIMAELNAPATPTDSLWGTWAAEPPQARVEVRSTGDGWQLHGRKAWCSGAAVLTHGLLTAWDEQGQQQLVAVALQQPGVTVSDGGWVAVGMAATASGTVQFDGAQASLVGGPGDYLARPGFWQGAIGIAACWFGAARQLGRVLQAHCAQRDEPHALAHLGAVDTALHAAACVLRDCAETVDREPAADVALLARRARSVVERAAEQVIQHTGRALGAGPYCQQAHFARLIADLPVFLRQSHAERDLAHQARLLDSGHQRIWTL